MICKKLIRKINTIFIIIPNQVPNQIVEAIVINSPSDFHLVDKLVIPGVVSLLTNPVTAPET